MSEAPVQASETQNQFIIQKIYVKDMSFETPNSPTIFREKWEPEVNLQLSNTAVTLSENTHEVTLTLMVTAKLEDKTAYLAEVQQAGIFNITAGDQKHVAALLGSYCPNLLFPFARETIADLVMRGGFPQLLLAPINFDALYHQHIEQSLNKGKADNLAH